MSDAQGEPTTIVTITQVAREKLIEILEKQQAQGRAALRIEVRGRNAAGFEYGMSLEEDSAPEPGDAVQDEGDFKVFVDAATLPKLQGSTVDFVGQLMGGGFRIDNPNPAWDNPIAQSVQEILDSEINPGVASHGGFVELIDVREDTVFVRLGGGCQGCGMVDVTLRQGIERLIRERLPDIKSVVDTTDHAGGNNPYYQPSKGGEGASPFHQPAKG